MSWRLDGDKHAMNLDIVGPAGRIAMMDCENFEMDDDELGANARLIAAAPEMLRALKQAYAHFMKHTQHDCWDDDDDDVMLLMFDAIRSAKGDN